jgi:hypothetical protein
MSEIKVNKISPRTACGTTTLGDSGDTISIPAGVTITNSGTASGFGATGAASWSTTVKTGDFTATAGIGYFVNTTSGEVDVALPAGTAGAVVAVKDYANNFNTANCILVPNGSEKIGGLNNNAILSTEGQAVTLLYIDAVQGWLVTDDGLQSSADNNPYMVATGGTITTSGNDKIHTFTGPGTFTVCQTADSAANNAVSYMVVAGGGAGGDAGDRGAGGGGAGGFREDKSPVTPYTASPLEGAGAITVTATAYPITVGAGAAGRTAPNQGLQGSSSIFSTITSAGGGGGGGESSGADRDGTAGGSGGGGGKAGGPDGTAGAGNTPPVSPAQGFAGAGGGGPAGNPNAAGGGGGGATALGLGPPVGNANGGAGATTSISGSPVAYAGGGGAAGGSGATPSNKGAGGTGGGGGGGGNPAPDPATPGTVNTGGGGGGTSDNSGGGSGGSGVVIIRYKYQ